MTFQMIDIQAPRYQNFIKYKRYRDEFEKVARAQKVEFVYKWVAEGGNT